MCQPLCCLQAVRMADFEDEKFISLCHWIPHDILLLKKQHALIVWKIIADNIFIFSMSFFH
jgi:hypothetical protein